MVMDYMISVWLGKLELRKNALIDGVTSIIIVNVVKKCSDLLGHFLNLQAFLVF